MFLISPTNNVSLWMEPVTMHSIDVEDRIAFIASYSASNLSPWAIQEAVFSQWMRWGSCGVDHPRMQPTFIFTANVQFLHCSRSNDCHAFQRQHIPWPHAKEPEEWAWVRTGACRERLL